MADNNDLDAQKQFIAQCPTIFNNIDAPVIAQLRRLRHFTGKALIGPGDHCVFKSDDDEVKVTIKLGYFNQGPEHYNDLLDICGHGTEIVIYMTIGGITGMWIGRLHRGDNGEIVLKFSSRFESVAHFFNEFRHSKHGNTEFRAYTGKGAAPVVTRNDIAAGDFKWIVRLSVIAAECLDVANARSKASDGTIAQLTSTIEQLSNTINQLKREKTDLENQRTTFQALNAGQEQTASKVQDLQNLIRDLGNTVYNNNQGGGNNNNNNNNGGNNNNNNGGGNNNNNGGNSNNFNNNNGGGNNFNNNNNNNNNGALVLNNNVLGSNVLSASAAISLANNPLAAAQSNPMAYAHSNPNFGNKVAYDMDVDGVDIQFAFTWGPVVIANDPAYIRRRFQGYIDRQYGANPNKKIRETVAFRAKNILSNIVDPLTALCLAYSNGAASDNDIKDTFTEIQPRVVTFFATHEGYSETTIDHALNKHKYTGLTIYSHVFKGIPPDFGRNNNNNNNNNNRAASKKSFRGGRGGRGGGGNNHRGGRGSGNQAAGGQEQQ